MIQQFTFDGTGRQIDARGVNFRYESGTDTSGNTDLKLWVDGSAVGTFSPGDLLELPEACKRWEVKPVSSNCTGVVKIGMGKVTTTKVAGVVNTVDVGRSRSINGNNFVFSANVQGTATTSAVAVLFNPAGSGKRILVKSSRFSQSVGGPNGVAGKNTTIGTQQSGVTGSSGIVPKSFDKQTSAAQCWASGSVSPAPDFATSLTTAVLAANAVDAVLYSDPICIEPGRGLVWFSTTNANMILVAEFTEELI
jgi:hypothetical protein